MSEIKNGRLGLYDYEHSKCNHLTTVGFKGLTTYSTRATHSLYANRLVGLLAIGGCDTAVLLAGHKLGLTDQQSWLLPVPVMHHWLTSGYLTSRLTLTSVNSKVQHKRGRKSGPGGMFPPTFLGWGRSCFLSPPLSVQNNCDMFHTTCYIQPTYAI